MGRDAEDWREGSSEGCRQSSNKEGIEGVKAPGDREPSDLGIEGRGRGALDMWRVEYYAVESKKYTASLTLIATLQLIS